MSALRCEMIAKDSARSDGRLRCRVMSRQADGRVAHASDQPPVAAQTLARMASPVACPSRLVGTPAQAVGGSVLTLPLLCLCRRTEEYSGAYESDREKKVPCHGRPPEKGARQRQILTCRRDQIQQAMDSPRPGCCQWKEASRRRRPPPLQAHTVA